MRQHFDYTQFNNELTADSTRNTQFVRYLNDHNFDIRGIVLGVELERLVENDGTIQERFDGTVRKTREYLLEKGKEMIEEGINAEKQYGIKIRTYRITTSPVPWMISRFSNNTQSTRQCFRDMASMLDDVAEELTTYCQSRYDDETKSDPRIVDLYKNELAAKGIEKDVYIAGLTGKVEKGTSQIDIVYLDMLPDILGRTNRLFASVNFADTRYGINTDIVSHIASKIIEMGNNGAKFSAVTNMPCNTPFFPASYHAAGDQAITLGMAGAGVLTGVIEENHSVNYNTLERRIIESQELMVKISERIGKQIAERIGTPYLGLDLSQGSVYSQGTKNSIAAAIEGINGRKIGSPGTVNDFGLLLGGLQKGAEAATSLLVGYGGEFIPVSEDYIMALRMQEGVLTYHGLLAMSGICAAGIDMLIVDRYTKQQEVESVLLDVATMAAWNKKPLGTRLIVPDSSTSTTKEGFVFLGGLLGEGPEHNLGLKWKDPERYRKNGGNKPRSPGSIRG